MADRSYLFSVDGLPTETDNPTRISGISEHNWSIPLAHLLFVGCDTTVVPSLIWAPRIGIAGDFTGGADLVRRFLAVLGAGELDDRTRFDALVAKVDSHLAEPAHRGDHFLLETGELVADDNDEAEERIRRFVAHDIPEAVARAEAAIAGDEQEWLGTVRRQWSDQFESFYNRTLYYSFRQAD